MQEKQLCRQQGQRRRRGRGAPSTGANSPAACSADDKNCSRGRFVPKEAVAPWRVPAPGMNCDPVGT